MSIQYYAKSLLPKCTHEFFKQNIYSILPLKYRMGRNYWRLRKFLDKAQWWDKEKILSWQYQKLKEIIEYAYHYVPGYHSLYQEAGVKPEDIRLFEDIKLLPFTTKELIRDNLKDFTTRDSKQKISYMTTGGSTGIPFGFYWTSTNLWMEAAFIHESWQRVNWQVGDKNAVLRGLYIGNEKKFYAYKPHSKELYLSSYYLTEKNYCDYLTLMQRYKTHYLHAYPSSISNLANFVLENKTDTDFFPSVIFLGSENVYNWQLEKIQKAFPKAKLFAHYGQAEEVILAPWCQHERKYHVWPFYGYHEILNGRNEIIKEGEIGELIGTSFWSFGTPFIRYRTMDKAQKDKWGCCKCGRQFPLISVIEGRLQEVIISGTGRRISMAAINMHTNVFDHLYQFQFYQEKPGEIIFKIVPKSFYTEFDQVKIEHELLKKLGKDIKLFIQKVDKMEKTKSGKYRFLVQKLNVRDSD